MSLYSITSININDGIYKKHYLKNEFNTRKR